MKTFYEMLNILEKNKNQNKILERIFLDIKLLTEEEYQDEIESEDEGPLETEDPFTGSEDAEPVSLQPKSYLPSIGPRKSEKRKLAEDTRDSMVNVRYKAMHERKKLIDTLKQTQSAKILEDLGYNPDLPGALQSALSESGNDIPEARIEFIESKTMHELKNEFLENLFNSYTIYGSNEEKADRLNSEILEKILNSLTIRRISKNNEPHDWSSPTPLVDESASAINKYINAVIKGVKADQTRTKEKVMGGGAEEDDYKDVIKNLPAPAASEEESENQTKLNAIRNAFKKLESLDKKATLSFLLLFGLDDAAEEFASTGKINLSPGAEYSMVMKVNKSGVVSTTVPDYDVVVEKLKTKFGIDATRTQVIQWRNRATNTLREELSDMRTESLSFNNWLQKRIS